MIIGLAGAAGSGKDSVADVLVAECGFRRMAFADALYAEVSTAFNVPVEFLKNRETKEAPTSRLALRRCVDPAFVRVVMRLHHVGPLKFVMFRWKAWSPRQILQWLGTDYRRQEAWSSRPGWRPRCSPGS